MPPRLSYNDPCHRLDMVVRVVWVARQSQRRCAHRCGRERERVDSRQSLPLVDWNLVSKGLSVCRRSVGQGIDG